MAREKAVQVRDVSKSFGSYQALNSVSFDIGENEFFTMLGPSGCGKTTLLRLLAGFESPDSGAILLKGREVTAIPPHKRRVNTVFQSYALFPHMTLEQNVAYGLENLGWDRAKIRARAGEMLERVHMSAMASRRPGQLSGGQRQRVALARALAPEPEILLLDEPLSALDLKLRQAMRDELRHLQRDTGITFVFVTHDQEEALDMSDRIAVLGAGAVQQIGSPAEIYEEPVNRFVADFVGETNFLAVEVVQIAAGIAQLNTPLGRFEAVATAPLRPGPATLSIRPEKISLGDQVSEAAIRLPARITSRNYMGGFSHYTLEAGGVSLRASRRNASREGDLITTGQEITIGFLPASARVLAS